MKYAFDFFNTLDKHEDVRELARRFFAAGHEVHIVSAISPGLPLDSDEAYALMLKGLNVPFTRIWRVDHVPEQKLSVLLRIGAVAFWDDVEENVSLARANAIPSCHVGVDPHNETKLVRDISVADLLPTASDPARSAKAVLSLPKLKSVDHG